MTKAILRDYSQISQSTNTYSESMHRMLRYVHTYVRTSVLRGQVKPGTTMHTVGCTLRCDKQHLRHALCQYILTDACTVTQTCIHRVPLHLENSSTWTGHRGPAELLQTEERMYSNTVHMSFSFEGYCSMTPTYIPGWSSNCTSALVGGHLLQWLLVHGQGCAVVQSSERVLPTVKTELGAVALFTTL